MKTTMLKASLKYSLSINTASSRSLFCKGGLVSLSSSIGENEKPLINKSSSQWGRHPHKESTRKFSSMIESSDEVLNNALKGDLKSIAEIGRQFFDGERLAEDKILQTRKWLELAAELGNKNDSYSNGNNDICTANNNSYNNNNYNDYDDNKNNIR
jgi:hypothetical protein